MKVLVTGAAGFVGKNLCVALRQRKDAELIPYDLGDPASVLQRGLAEADLVLHLAGVNRPEKVEEFETGNVGFLGEVLKGLALAGRKPKVVLTSSIQAERDNPSIVDTISRMYAQHPGLIKTLGSAALSIAMAKIAQRQSGGR